MQTMPIMEFWGAEVKNEGSLKVQPGKGKLLHLSQACVGEVKKGRGNDYIRLYVQMNDQKFVAGMLSPDRMPHITLDLIFEDVFYLSHDLKQGSVHFVGYTVDDSKSLVDEDESDDDLEEPVPIDALNHWKPEAIDLKPSGSKASAGVKPEKAEGKSKVKIVEPSKDAKNNVEDDETDDDEDDDEDDEDDESAEDEEMASSGAGSDEEDESGEEDDSDEEEDSDEETPKKPEPAKKRPGESTSKTSVPEKKAKFSTPQQKTEGKKVSGHVATPHPAKGKTAANADKSNKQTPTKSFACPSCSKSFGSEQAVQSHSKAKHNGN